MQYIGMRLARAALAQGVRIHGQTLVTGLQRQGDRWRVETSTGSADFQHLERAVALLFPNLAGARYEYRWGGRVAITRDFMSHVHEPAPGLTIALGYNGRGIATATTMGKHIARRLAGTRDVFPFPISPIKPIPLHGLQRFYIAAGLPGTACSITGLMSTGGAPGN